MNLTIYKTSVETTTQVQHIRTLLDQLPLVTQWNFDLDDCDNILRIISRDLQPSVICTMLQAAGYNCETMESFVYNH
jgi:cell fate (sporulation/competence/biofilm development) regulator YmcA (YheA/YmcA/DUF963 family)